MASLSRGRLGTNALPAPIQESYLKRLVGHSNETTITFNGRETNALVDSGSMITTVTDEFYKSLSPCPILMSFGDLNLDIKGAGGNQLPYLGYIEAEIQVSFLPNCDIQVPVLVVPVTDYGLHAPVVIGTNVIRLCRNSCDSEATIPDTWKNAFVSFQQGSVGVIKSTNKVNIKIKPNETITLSGMVKNCRQFESAVTETTQGASSRIGVCPRVVKVESVGKNQRVPIRIYNISAKEIEISP